MVCTDLAARGLDFPGTVDHVINFDFPLNPIDYLHRTGRTARAGAPGRVTSLIAGRDRVLARRIEWALQHGEPLDALSSDKEVLPPSLAHQQRPSAASAARRAAPAAGGPPRRYGAAALAPRGSRGPAAGGAYGSGRSASGGGGAAAGTAGSGSGPYGSGGGASKAPARPGGAGKAKAGPAGGRPVTPRGLRGAARIQAMNERAAAGQPERQARMEKKRRLKGKYEEGK